MESSFFIPMKNIDSEWNLANLDYDFSAEEYCEEVLDIPIEHIYDATLTKKGLEITLGDLEDVLDEDWYIQLSRISSPLVA